MCALLSKRTVKHCAHALGIRSRITARKLLINVTNRGRRVHRSTRTLPSTLEGHWSRVLYSDESRFKLFWNHGRVRIWGTSGSGVGDFRVWGMVPACMSYRCTEKQLCFCYDVGVHGIPWDGELVFLVKTITTRAYMETPKSTDISWKYFEDRQHPFIFHYNSAPTPPCPPHWAMVRK